MGYKMRDTSVATCLECFCAEALRRNKIWRLCSCHRALVQEVWGMLGQPGWHVRTYDWASVLVREP